MKQKATGSLWEEDGVILPPLSSLIQAVLLRTEWKEESANHSRKGDSPDNQGSLPGHSQPDSWPDLLEAVDEGLSHYGRITLCFSSVLCVSWRMQARLLLQGQI